MNEPYKDPKLKSFGEWMSIVIEHREGRMTDGELLGHINKLQDAYKDLHYACNAVVNRFSEAYNK